eukprot:CAMPEP_0181097828 /NCGR_PEP_ID=MMETSP1071-20121207/11780_1 /TAXON_ID=35127 /ORGANISM="Thalassiosira sp., Strain NH16" /LENGTH=346 /DNA_ID=CAMNT_0023180341 /DNA_START=85 /DNA_END=1126 /DNA_ORIENTATION=-
MNAYMDTPANDPLGRGPKPKRSPPRGPISNTSFQAQLCTVGGSGGPMFPDVAFEGSRAENAPMQEQRPGQYQPPMQQHPPQLPISHSTSAPQMTAAAHHIPPQSQPQQNVQPHYPPPTTRSQASANPRPNYYAQQPQVPMSTRSAPANPRPPWPPPQHTEGGGVPPSPMQIYMSSSNTQSQYSGRNGREERDQPPSTTATAPAPHTSYQDHSGHSNQQPPYHQSHVYSREEREMPPPPSHHEHDSQRGHSNCVPHHHESYPPDHYDNSHPQHSTARDERVVPPPPPPHHDLIKDTLPALSTAPIKVITIARIRSIRMTRRLPPIPALIKVIQVPTTRIIALLRKMI